MSCDFRMLAVSLTGEKSSLISLAENTFLKKGGEGQH
jgi:hypothetical protein